MSEVVDQLKTIIAEDLDVNLKAAEIDEDASLFEGGLGLDSIAIVELISLIEKKFSLQFTDSELNPECFSNLKVLTSAIDGKLAAV